jgi:hypothetical protein
MDVSILADEDHQTVSESAPDLSGTGEPDALEAIMNDGSSGTGESKIASALIVTASDAEWHAWLDSFLRT